MDSGTEYPAQSHPGMMAQAGPDLAALNLVKPLASRGHPEGVVKDRSQQHQRHQRQKGESPNRAAQLATQRIQGA